MLNTLIDAALGRPPMMAAVDPSDDRWWSGGPSVYRTETGLTVTPRLALGVSCMFQGIRLIGETLGSLPLHAIRRRPDGGRERVADHLGERTLHQVTGAPNPWQTGQQLRETMVAQAVLWGTGYSEIRYSGRGLALVPIDPDTVQVEQLSDLRLRYQVQPQPDAMPGSEESRSRTLAHEQVWRVNGLSLHRFMPPSLLALSREAVGHWLAMQRYNNLYFAQGATQSLWIEHPQKPSPAALERWREMINSRISGLRNMHRIFVGEQGAKVTPFGFNAEESQLTESWQPAVEECARWLNIPIHMLRAGKQPTFASIEQFGREFIDLTLRPWATRVEGSIYRDLLADQDVVLEHVFEGLLRGDLLARCTAYASAIMNGWMAENEVRERENLPPMPGLDTPRRSANQDRGGDPRDSGGRPGNAGAAGPRRLHLIARQAAERVVETELRMVTKQAEHFAGDPLGWRTWLATWYQGHADLVSRALELEPGVARGYCETHRAALAAEGMEAAATWETEAPERLLELALETSP
jgi:HK97 family phage portal protein